MIPIYSTYIDPMATESVADILASTYISEGKKVKEFEEQLASKLGIIRPVAVNSGTAALHLALVLAGIGPGDEVIVPAQTFVATALVIHQQGAKVVFADVNYRTGNIDIESLRNRITSRTKAVIPVHWAGMPCDLDAINELAEANGFLVIEDAAHALGAIYKGKSIGSISPYTCFSFQAIKHVTTGDGGAVACLDESKAEEALTRRWFGIDRKNSTPSFLGERQYDISQQGFKYHLNDYAAALGIANLSGIEERLASLRNIATYYREMLEKVAGISLWDAPSDRESAWWLFGMHVENRDSFIQALASRQVTASVVHQRIDRNSLFGGIDRSLYNQAKFDATQVHIPLHAGVDMEKAEYVVEAIKKGW